MAGNIESILGDLRQAISPDLQALVSVETTYGINVNPLKNNADEVIDIVLKTARLWGETEKNLTDFLTTIEREIETRAKFKKVQSEVGDLQTRIQKLSSVELPSQSKTKKLENPEIKKLQDQLKESVTEMERLDALKKPFQEVTTSVEETAGQFAFYDYNFMQIVKKQLENQSKSKGKTVVQKATEGFLDAKIKQRSSELEAQNHSLKDIEVKIAEAKKKIEDRKNEHKRIHVALQKKQKEVGAAKRTHEKEVFTVADIKEKVKTIKEEKEIVQKEVDVNREELKKIKSEKAVAAVEKKALTQEKNEMQVDIEKVKKDLPQLQQVFSAQRQHRDDAETSIRKVKKVTRKLEKDFKEELVKRKKLDEDLAQLKSNIEIAQKEYAVNTQVLHKQIDELDILKSAIGELTDQIKTLQSSIEGCKKDKERLVCEKEKFLLEKAYVEREIQNITQETDTLKQEIEYQNSNLENFREVWTATLSEYDYLREISKKDQEEVNNLKGNYLLLVDAKQKIVDKIATENKHLKELELELTQKEEDIDKFLEAAKFIETQREKIKSAQRNEQPQDKGA